MNRVVWESRHKFVYYDYESIESLRWLEQEYPVELDSSVPIVIYEMDKGLPKVDTKLVLDKYIIKSFHERYYEILIFLSMIDSIANRIDHNELNIRLKRLFKLVSYSSNKEIRDVNTLRSMLIDSKNIYKDAYLEYMCSGNCDFYNKLPIKFILIDGLVSNLKKAIGLEKYFSFMLELTEDISIYTCMAINDYIASRCNGYLSMNILLSSDRDWKYYYANNGQFIQGIHDYTEVDFRKSKTRERSIQK